MPHSLSTSEAFLLAMAIIFTVPWLVWRLARADNIAPLVVVQVIGGILLGPSMLGAAFPDYYTAVFRPDVVTALNGLAWWAVMLFVWGAGIELDLRSAWADRRQAGTTAALALVVPLLFGSVAALVLLHFPGWVGTRGAPWQTVLGIGMACAVTALPVLLLVMDELKILRAPLGQRLLRYASLDDVAIWAVLAFILLDWERIGRQLAFLLVFAAAAVAIRALMRRLAEKDRWPVGIIWLIVCGLAADWSGLHYMVGAFLAGAVLDSDMFDRARLDSFRSTVLLVLMPVYFLSTGLKSIWSANGLMVLGGTALLFIAAFAGKLVAVGMAGRILRWPRGEALVIGLLLQTKGLVGIVFANVLLDKQIIGGDSFTALLLMSALSTMLTIPAVRGRLLSSSQQRL
ncbi:MAG: cation:proton antiporter [Sphingobium sp.]|nr:cation:proton antiporter [Sphingobium sp.]